MTISLPPPIAKALEEVHWLRDGAVGAGGEFAERLLFPLLLSSKEELGTLPDRIRCSLPRTGGIPAEAVSREVTKLLRKSGHPSPDWFAGLLVAIVALIRNRASETAAIAILDRILGTCTPTTAWHYRVIDRQLTGPATLMPAHSVGPFWFGPLTEEELVPKLASNCMGRPADLLERWSGRYVMRYRAESVALWPLGAWARLLGSEKVVGGLRTDVPWFSALNSANQDYYARMHTLVESSSLSSLRQQAALCSLHGGNPIDPALLRDSETESRFTVFSALGEHAPDLGDDRKAMSWIAEVGRAITPVNDAMRTAFRKDLLARLESMEATYRDQIQRYRSPRLHPLVRGFVERLASAHAHAERRSDSAAFLDYVIAIEVLFSEKESTTDAVSSRTGALLAFTGENTEADARPQFDSVFKEVRRLYGVRSNLVHRGVEVSPEDLASLREIVTKLTPVVLRWNDRAAPENEASHLSWLRLIDYTRATIEMGRPVPSNDLFSLGVIAVLPDNGGLRINSASDAGRSP